jgi:superfamily I DNA/RNA helicase
MTALKTLPLQPPTPEQLPIIQNTRPGCSLIRGSAGSGKTTTALLRLRQLSGFWLARRERMESTEPVRVLVVTFNRTLRGYIAEMAERQAPPSSFLRLTVTTFAKLTMDTMGGTVVNEETRKAKLQSLIRESFGQNSFVLDEAEYAMGRFPTSQINEYVSCERSGRGLTPRFGTQQRRQLIDNVITPFNQWKIDHRVCDFNDLAIKASELASPPKFDIIVADESQDLSANEVRGLVNFAADPSSITFILDSAQRIYPRGFTWREVGLTIRSQDTYRLQKNHRNTVEICAFASPLLADMDVGDDGTIPNLNSCDRHGPKPLVVKGRYAKQVDFAIKYIRENIDLSVESVAFLKPLGGNWFSTLKSKLSQSSLPFVDLTRSSEWPQGSENIALSTMSSAKGLEFDHVIILGFNEENAALTTDRDDDSSSRLRRLLAMAITRARSSVIVGFKPSEASSLTSYFATSTFDEVIV